MKMYDAAHAVTEIESEAVRMGLDRGRLPGFWEWLTEGRRYGYGELTHESVGDILRNVEMLVREYKEVVAKDLAAWAARIEASEDNGL